MHTDAPNSGRGTGGFDDLRPGTPLGPLTWTISAAANERYWSAAGVDHPALRAGALYPPSAANLTVLLTGTVCADPLIQTRQHLVCHGRAEAGATLVGRARVTDRFVKRGRDYVEVEASITRDDDTPLWTSTVVFTPARTLRAPANEARR